MGNVDPIAAVIGVVGLILAAATFVLHGVSLKARAIIAGCCLVLAAVGVGFFLLFPLSPGPDSRGDGTLIASPTSNGRPTSGPPGATSPSVAASSLDVEILTTEYRRTEETNSIYRIPTGISNLDFRYGWISRTPDGDLATDDCVVNARLVNKANDAVIENYPSNDCTRQGLKQTRPLAPGTYDLVIEITRTGSTSSSSKDITVLPAV